MFLQLINHASFVCSNGKKNLLTDPWYNGAVFDGGWKLLIENNKTKIKSLLKILILSGIPMSIQIIFQLIF
jgi:L-ascorbate metabolism protein UlaG (beta-lactamase superfamily)